MFRRKDGEAVAEPTAASLDDEIADVDERLADHRERRSAIVADLDGDYGPGDLLPDDVGEAPESFDEIAAGQNAVDDGRGAIAVRASQSAATFRA